MHVLVDYNNIPAKYRQRGLHDVIMPVLETLPEHLLPHGSQLEIRLYGGWYDSHRLSRAAQTLATAIETYSPAPISMVLSGERRSLRIFVELARSLMIDPARIIPNTYRVKSAPRNLRPKSLPYTGCACFPSCPLLGIHHLLTRQECPQPNCHVQVAEVIERHEQKLVDTMLTVDLIQATTLGGSDVVLVTSDDDLWPGIRTATSAGVCVHHVRTRQTNQISLPVPSHLDHLYQKYSL